MKAQHFMALAGILFTVVACSTLPEGPPPAIKVGAPKIYNDAGLQSRLQQVGGRLARISGLDQTQLSSHIGTTQAATLKQYQGSVQATMQPIPGSQIVTNTGTQSGSVSTTNGSTLQTGGTAGNSTNNNSTTTTTVNTPNNTTQTTTSAAAITPSVPGPVTATSFAAPSQFSQNALGTLDEQLQLEMELVTLQTLLEPPINSEYSPDGHGRRHVTVGFPITIPRNATRKSLGAAAEVEITVCPYKNIDSGSTEDRGMRPSLITIIPKEKTYNTVSITNKSMGVGLGAIAGVFNVGGNFSWTHDTYYIVRAQDTVAFGGADSPDEGCKSGAKPLRFGWLFKPVLGQKTVQAGFRESLAQLSLPRTDIGGLTSIVVRTQWREFDTASGTAGEVIPGSEDFAIFPELNMEFDTLNVVGLDYQDAKGGLGIVTVSGHFLPGTRVRMGTSEISGVDVTGTFLRFAAPNQSLATSTISLLSPDGTQLNLDDTLFPTTVATRLDPAKSDSPMGTKVRGYFTDIVDVRWPRSSDANTRTSLRGNTVLFAADADVALRAKLVREDGQTCDVVTNDPEAPVAAKTSTVSATLVEVILPLHQCIEIQPEGTYPLVAVIGNQAFGFPETPFSQRSLREVRFVAPRGLVENAGTVELGRLLLGKKYRTTYALPKLSQFRIDSISISAISATEVRYIVLGSGLSLDDVISPADTLKKKAINVGRTMQEFSLSAADAVAVKKIVFQRSGEAPYVFDLPQPPKKEETKKDEKKDGKGFTMTIEGTLPK